MGLLNDLGLKHNTDKAHTHFYLDNYELYFNSIRNEEFVLLELGVAGGSSIRMWREYFPKAKIFGIDNNKDCLMEGVFIGDATDEVFLTSVLSATGMPNCVIDDSGHVGSETIKSFEILFPLIKSGGLYFVEDCATFYSKTYSGELERNGRTKVYNFFTDLAYDVDVAGRGMCGNQDFAINHPTTEPTVPKYSRLLKAIHIYPSLRVFIRK